MSLVVSLWLENFGDPQVTQMLAQHWDSIANIESILGQQFVLPVPPNSCLTTVLFISDIDGKYERPLHIY